MSETSNLFPAGILPAESAVKFPKVANSSMVVVYAAETYSNPQLSFPKAPMQTWYLAPGKYPPPARVTSRPEGPLLGATETVAEVGTGATEVELELVELTTAEPRPRTSIAAGPAPAGTAT